MSREITSARNKRAEAKPLTIILVVALFVIVIAAERLAHKEAPGSAFQAAPRAALNARRIHPIVAGYETPEGLRFHQGHSWAQAESPNLVRAGIDHFAAKLIGRAEEVTLPQRGQWIRQGQKVWSFRVNGKLVEMVSPIEGTVTDVNEEVVRHPEMLTVDPYGESWLMRVQSSGAQANFRNLLTGNMACNLMDESAKKLAKYIPTPTGKLTLVQGGGEVEGGVAEQLPSDKYMEITREFFLAA